jgi:prepilin-type N-terminal cleavage/methylation domain-containing protein
MPGRRHAEPCGRRQAGFTLIELTIAAAVFGLLMTVLLGVHLAAERQQEESYRVVEANQHARTGLDMIARDLRMAGSGFGNMPVFMSFGGFPVPARYPVLPQPSTAEIDSVEIIGGQEGIRTALSVDMVNEVDDIQVDDAGRFRVGEMVLVTDGAQAHIFQITGINGNTLQHDHLMSPWNYGGAAAWPPFGYSSGSRVTQVEYVRYYIDSTDPEHPVLMRWRANDPAPTFVAKNVERLRLSYATGDTTSPNPVDPLNIRSVDVNATTVAGGLGDAGNVRRRLRTEAVPRILD